MYYAIKKKNTVTAVAAFDTKSNRDKYVDNASTSDFIEVEAVSAKEATARASEGISGPRAGTEKRINPQRTLAGYNGVEPAAEGYLGELELCIK